MIRTGGLNNRYIRLLGLIRVALVAAFIVVFYGLIIHIIEPSTFPTLFDGIWWALVTASTVGYGDFAPQTLTGKIIGSLLIIMGIGLVTTYFASLASVAVTIQTDLVHGRKSYNKNNHIIIIGWNERAKKSIIQLKKSDNKNRIVLIDETLDENPFIHNTVHFINGKGSNDEILLKANIKESSTVLITSDQSKDEYQSDMFTIMCLLAIKGLNPDVYCIAELLTEEQTENAKRAGADTIIKTNAIISSVMERSLTAPIHEKETIIVNHEYEQFHVDVLPVDPEYVSKNVKETKDTLFTKGYVLIGIKKGEDVVFNPLLDSIIQDNDMLIVGKT